MTGSAKIPRLVGSGRVKGMAQLHQALPLIERQHALIEELRARAPRHVPGAELALRTGTTVRTVERDIARLHDADGEGPGHSAGSETPGHPDKGAGSNAGGGACECGGGVVFEDGGGAGGEERNKTQPGVGRPRRFQVTW